MVALHISVWISYETNLHRFCDLHTEWVQVIQCSPGLLFSEALDVFNVINVNS